jgi:hypothetical protein
MSNPSVAITKTVIGITKNLSPRNRDIVFRRFGLKSGRKETLESIGKSYGITRERVRQIEDFSMNQLSKTVDSNPDTDKYVSQALSLISHNGGVMKETQLFNEFSGSDKETVANSSLIFILTLAGRPARFYENDLFHSFWASDRSVMDSFVSLVSGLVKTLDKSKGLIAESELASFATQNGASQYKFETILSISKELSRNVFGQVGLSRWPEVKPKGVRDKAYLVLKRENEPKHFSEIAKLINSIGFSNRKANVQTVHNELIKDSRFVLVGRGMYGLSEWGYKPGTVKDVLVDILRNSAKPLNKSELVAKVMNARMVKENTIVLNLQDSKLFSRKGDGTYTLKKA